MAVSRIALGTATFVMITLPFVIGVPSRPKESGHSPTPATTVVVAYYTGGIPPSRIPATLLTHIIYAFGPMRGDGTCAAPDSKQSAILAGLRRLRAANPHLGLLISLGGWGGDGAFSMAAATAVSRKAFAASCIREFVVGSGVDGIDIDWEFPVRGGVARHRHRPEDRANVTLLFAEFRRELNQLTTLTGKRYLLTAATPTGRFQTGGAFDPEGSFDLSAVANYVDWLNVMTYDMNTGFSPVSNFNTPMREVPGDPTPAAQRRWNNVTSAVRYYERRGVPAGKIVLGVAFYGRRFLGVSARNFGLFSRYTGVVFGPDWRVLHRDYLRNPAWQPHWSDAAQVPWLYDRETQSFLSYDDPKSIRIKAIFARRAGLRGVMIWDLSNDDAQWSLLRALAL